MKKLSIGPLAMPRQGSPMKGGDGRQNAQFRTPTKRKEKNTFPTTPRSVEKQKKMLQARLKRLMENHLRMTATNKMLSNTNKMLLD